MPTTTIRKRRRTEGEIKDTTERADQEAFTRRLPKPRSAT